MKNLVNIWLGRGKDENLEIPIFRGTFFSEFLILKLCLKKLFQKYYFQLSMHKMEKVEWPINGKLLINLRKFQSDNPIQKSLNLYLNWKSPKKLDLKSIHYASSEAKSTFENSHMSLAFPLSTYCSWRSIGTQKLIFNLNEK